MARPFKEINQKAFENLCGLLCTEAEICAFFDVTDKTLSSWCRRTYGKGFSDIYRIKSKAGLTSLRRAQFLLAQKSPAMAIFLGKNYLGQRDSFHFEDQEALARLDAILKSMTDEAHKEAE